MAMTTPKTGGDNAEAGHRVGGFGQNLDRPLPFFFVGGDLLIHQIIKLFGVGRAADDQAQGIEEHAFSRVVGHEFWIFLKNFAVGRIVNVLFHGHFTAFTHHREHFEHHGEQFHVVGFAIAVVHDGVHDTGNHRLDGLDRRADDQSAQGGAADNQKFNRLHEDADRAALDDEATEHRTEDDCISNDGKQRFVTPLSDIGRDR